MDKEKLASELVKIAKDLVSADKTAGVERMASYDILDTILPQRQLAKLRKGDEITYKLAVKAYMILRKRLELTSGEAEALNRLQYAVGSNDAGMVQNNVFKAAHALGLKLPHSSF